MRNHFLFVCCISLLVAACGKANSSESVIAEKLSLKKIDLGSHSSPLVGVRFAEMLGHVSYVPLEAKAQSLLASVSKVLAHKGRFMVLDRQNSSVNVFSATGMHLFSVGRIGHGPGEFLRLDDMDVDTENNQLLLWSNDNTAVFKYNLVDGAFIEKLDMPFFGAQFGLMGDYYISYTDCNLGKNNIAKNVFVSDRKGVIKYSFFPFPAERFTAAFSFSGFLSKNDEGYLFAYALSDTVYQISNDFKVFPKYHFDFGEKTWTKHFGLFDHEEFMMKGVDYSILNSPMFEWGDCLFFKFTQDRRIKKGFVHKGENELYTSDDFDGDIEFELWSIPVGRSGSFFISAVYPDRVYAAREKYPDFDERLAKNPTLKKLVDAMKADDNPILMLYSMKL